jgi:hypothetical protein
MTKDTPIPVSDPKIIHRFPRLPVHEKIAELGQKVWVPPHFSVEELDGATRFIFSVPIQSTFQKQAPDDYRILFHAKKTTWHEALQKAYVEASGKKPIKDYINTVLYRLFCEALIILNTDASGLTGDYTKFKEDFVDKFRSASKRKAGRRPNYDKDKRATRLAERHATLLPRMGELRKFVNRLKQDGIDDENQIRLRVAAEFKDDWISFITDGTAFEMLLGDAIQGGIVRNATIAGKWAPWQLTVSVLRCEEKVRNPRESLSLITIFRAVIGGREKASRQPKK